MIKPEELRIGNLILFEQDGTVFTVKTTSKEGFDVYNRIESTWIEADQFAGIPLTEEWLVKFGFELGDNETVNDIYHNNTFYFIRIGGSELAINPENGVAWVLRNGCAVNVTVLVLHVHQLQNLYFALTGQELTIKEPAATI